MNMTIRIVALCAIATSAAAAPPASLLAPGARDQVPTTLVATAQSKSLAAVALDHAPVQVSHALDGAKMLDASPKPFVAQSREFWSDVGETELHSGIKITTSAPGALIRLSPQGGAAASLDAAGVLIRSNGRTLTATAASTTVADAKALRSAGMDVPDGSLAFRLAASTGSGEIQIVAAHAQGRYLVHVFEPDSLVVLSLGADHDTTLVGGTVRFHAALANGTLALASGIVTAPDGYSANLHFARNGDGSFSAAFTPDSAHSVGPQLWEAHAFTAIRTGNLSVLRDAKTAFAVSAPTARFGGDAQIVSDATGLHVTLGITAASPSRYQASGSLYATGTDGALHPAALAQSATWLNAGSGKIDLGFDAQALSTSGLHAPFELRDLRLVDQANMSLIERRERALAIN
jgi:hypothetical protein